MRRTRSHGDWIAVSSLAVATMLATGGQSARAQSFQGTGTVVGGSATINTNPGSAGIGASTTVTLNSSTAVINWSPTDTASGGGPIAFQPTGTTATFTNNVDLISDFAVLNRIVPTDPSRAVRFDGNIVSQLQSAAGGASRGGTVFFYSPGGILVGANAVFDVGNLGLTTSDLPYDPQTGAFSTSGLFQFQQAAAGTSVEIANGAQLHVGAAGPDNSSYLAIVAPRIVQDGAIDVNGSAALVAADAATIQFSPSGLFSIQVDQGSSATGTVLSNSGSITGAAGSSATFIHRIYMVAVPRNTAITMAIASGSTLGFDVAGAADVVGNTVVLSAGSDVVNGEAMPYRSQGGGSAQTALDIGAITATSAVRGAATGLASLTVQAGETANFASDLALGGAYRPGVGAPGGNGTLVSVTGSGAALTVNGNFDVNVFDSGRVDLTDVTDVSAATVAVDGGALSVGGRLLVHADRSGLTDGGSATGGTAVLSALNGAQITVGGAIDLGAFGTGASPDGAQTGGTGAGGTARLTYGAGAQVSAGSIAVFADGRGGTVSSGYGGAAGFGGTATVEGVTGGGSLTVTGAVEIGANGVGTDGFGCVTCIVDGGIGTGGSAQLRVAGSTLHTVAIGGNLTVGGNAQGGASFGATAGGATAGTAQVLATGGAHVLSVGGQTSVSADATAGQALSTAQSGAGVGGLARIVTSGAGLTLGDVRVSANGTGGVNADGGTGGTGTGGTAQMRIATGGGSINAGNVLVRAEGFGGGTYLGYVADGARGDGGTASVDASAGQISFAALSVLADAVGGDGAFVTGDAHGGLAAVRARGGAISVGGDVFVLADAQAGQGITGGAGTGGQAQVTVDGGSIAFGQADSSVYVSSIGRGGSGSIASGTGTGGGIGLTARNGTADFAGSVYANAAGSGGSSPSRSTGEGAPGGLGQGGTITLDAVSSTAGGATITGATMQLSATGVGGAGAGGLGVASPGGGGSGVGGAGGAGGQGVGGAIIVNAGVANGTLLISSLGVDAGASGGTGGDGGFSSTGTGGPGGAGGSAIAGTVLFDTNGALTGVTPTGRMQLGTLNVAATGYGGLGGAAGSGAQLGSAGAGGDATGGFVTVRVDRGGSLFQVDGATSILADGYGATGAGSTGGVDGGKGTGGTILVTSDGTTSGNQIKLGTLYADATGLGGASLTAPGGEGVGGSMTIIGGAGLAISASGLTLRAIGFGGQASSGFTGGAATGGLVSVDIRGGSTLDATGSVLLDASSVGGASSQTAATGGASTGGTASLLTTGGGITLGADVTVQANAFGGDAGSQGLGGAALGGLALLSAGNLDRQGNGGTLAVTGNAAVFADGYGGGGFNGGRGEGGTASITGRLGTVTLGSANVSGSGAGGVGFGGGAGGDGVGGEASVLTFNTLTGAADITIGFVSLAAYGQGGTGGTGLSNGSAGGAGGMGLGGNVIALGSAGNGRITLGDLTAVAEGRGGAGGLGGSNDGGIGGDGGVGGAGLGGAIQVGTQSGPDTGALNTGAGNFAQVYASAGGYGGTGGTGGFGPGGAGAGGAGGDATAGGATLLVRGSPVTLSGDGLFLAVASGGDGGAGSVQGAGGNATVGLVTGSEALVGAHLELTSRFLVDSQRGSLSAGVLSFQATATGGAGSANGTSTTLGVPIAFNVRNGDLTAQSISLFAPGQGPAGSIASPLTMQNGNAVIAGGFDFITGGDLVVSLDNANLSADHAQISGQNWIESGNVVATPGAITTSGQLYVYSGGDIVGDASLITAVDLSVNAPGAIRLNALSAGGPLFVSAGQSILLGDLSANAAIRVLGGGMVSIGAVQANGGVDLSAGGALTVAGPVAAVDGAILNASGVLNAGDISVTASNPGSLRELSVFASGPMTLGNLNAGATRLFGTQAIATGSVSATDLAVLGGGDMTLDRIAASGRVLLADAVMADAGGSPLGSTYDFDALFAASPLRAMGAIAIAGPVSAGTFTAATSQTLGIAGQITVGGDLSLDAAGALTFDRLSAGGAVTLGGGTALSGGDIVAGSLALTTGGDLLLANVSAAGDVTLQTSSAILTGSVSAGGDIAVSTVGDFTTTGLAADGAIRVTSASGALSLGTIAAQAGLVDLAAFGAITAGNLAAGTNLSVQTSAGDIVLGTVGAAAGSIDLLAGGALTTQDISAYGGIAAQAGTSMTLGNLSAATGNVALDAGGALSGLDIVAGQGSITLDTVGDAGLQLVSAFGPVTGRIRGDATFQTVASQDQGVQLAAGGTLTVSRSVLATTDIALVAGNDIALGLAVGRNMALLADGNVTAGRLVAGIFDPNTGATPGNGGILVAGRAMLDGGGQIGALDVVGLLSQTPARVGGTIAIGSAAGGSFAATASGDIFAGQIDATSGIDVDTSGIARVGGRWSAPSITLSSRDLVIATQSASGAPVGLDAGVSGSILLRSISEQGVVLGDGVGQSEYNISAAEWATIRSGSLTIRALDTANAIDIRIGNLEVTGPDAGSTIDDPNGVVRFQTVNPDGISGAIRISGNVSTRGFRATNALVFDTGRFELDASTGSLGIYGTGGALSGILRINADGIHVASGAILDKIAADPFYTGLEADLDQPAAVQRPDGVLAAGAFRFVVGSTFYVQNTGTAAASAGFLTAADGFSILPGTTTRPVRMIVNGKFTDGTTILSGTQAFDAFKANHQQLTIFDGESRIEGCLLTATSCGTMTEVPVEVVGPTISTQITILGQNGLGDTPRFVDTPDNGGGGDGGDGSTPEQQEQADKATAGPPIVPPTPLIDMRPLNPPGRIEEPVAGSGNPALMGSPVNENSAEGAQ